MVHDCVSWRMKTRRTALGFAVVALPFAYFDGSAAHAQSIMHSPSINIPSRIPTINPTVTPRIPIINPTVTPRINSNIAGTAVTGIGRTSPNLRTSPACSYAYRDSGGECRDQPVTSADGGGTGDASKGRNKNKGPRRIVTQTAAINPNSIVEIVAEIDGALSDAQADQLARRHGLERLQSQNFPLIGAPAGLFRITDRRSFETASRDLGTETNIRSVQRNFRYFLQDQK